MKKPPNMVVREQLYKLPLDEAYLYEAVARHVEKQGGSAVVIGGIEIQSWPGEPAGNFRVAVKVTGVKPKLL